MGTYVDKIPSISFGGTGAADVVKNHFDTTTAYASTTFGLTQYYIGELESLLQGLEVPDTGDLDVTEPYVPELNYGARPSLSDLQLPEDWPELLAVAPVLDTIPDLPPVDIPVMRFSPPIWNTPDKPVLDQITPPGDIPVLTMPGVPTAPSIVLPPVPVLDDILIPPAPIITLPLFDAELLEGETLDPPAGFSWQESPYNSDVWNDLLSNVLDGLRNGGTGLAVEVEEEIWARGLRRQDIDDEKLIRQIRETYAGYAMPPGALGGAEAEAYGEMSRNRQNLNSEITIKQAELAQANTHFITDKGVNLEEILRAFHDAQANRSIEAAKALVQSAVDVFNALISKRNLSLEEYKAKAVVYQQRVEAALAEIEIFKAMIEGAKVTADVQKNLVDIYEKQISAVEILVKMYATTMESVKIAGDIENLKLEAFKNETMAYVARLDGEKTKYDIYSAEMGGEETKAKIFSEQVKSFSAEVDGAKAVVDLNVATQNAAISKNGMELEQYKSQLFAYTAEVDATAKKIGAIVEGFRSETLAYSAETDATSAMYSAKVKEIDARIQQSGFLLQKAIAEIDAATKGYIAIKGLEIGGTEGIMNVSAQLASSSMTAVHASASIGQSYGESYGKSVNHSNSLGETHGYKHE